MIKLVSVIIPCYNCESTLKEAVESIIKQTYSNLEIIIVDDNSTDNSYKVASELRNADRRIVLIKNFIRDDLRYDHKLKRNINAGWSARNSGLSIAKGELITFQDADDVSLLNRIEIQVFLQNKYLADSITVDWLKFDNKFCNKLFLFDKYLSERNPKMQDPHDLIKLSKKTKGLFIKLFPKISKFIPFHIKRWKIINKLFFSSLESYPGTGNSPLLTKRVIENVRFRSLKNRIWPSFMGRGADRDFNLQVAETFKNSYVIHIPLYMWRVDRQNDNFKHTSINQYIS